MRIRSTTALTAATLLLGSVAPVLCGSAAWAQSSNPNASQIINQLKPTGDVSATTRGITLLQPGAAPAAPGAMASPGAMAAPGAMASPAAPAPVPAAPAVASAAPSTNLDITFESGSAALTPQATAELDQLGQALTSASLASYNFKIVGHTDTTGTPDANQSLSEQRAAAVKAYLESKYSISDSRLQATGVGENDLLVQTPPGTANESNRRVQIINLGQ